MLGSLGFAYASTGETDAARRVLAELHELEAQSAVTAHERAVIHIALGEWDTAQQELATAAEQRTGWAPWFPLEPLYDALRPHEAPSPARSPGHSLAVHP
jgi:hypothetical protein